MQFGPGCLSTFTAEAERFHALHHVSTNNYFFSPPSSCVFTMTLSKTLIPGPVNEGADVSTTPSKTAPGFWVAAGTVSTLVSPGRGARMLISGLTHCLRAWFLLLKYKMSFFLIAWFLGNGRRHKEVKWKRTAGHVCHPSKAKLKYRQDALLFSAYRKSHCAKEMQTYITHHKKNNLNSTWCLFFSLAWNMLNILFSVLTWI